MSTNAADLERNRRTGLRYIIVAALAVALVSVTLLLPVNRWAISIVEWARGAGVAGGLIYSFIYVVATVFLVPGSVLTAGAGFMYGPLWGTLIVWPVSIVAASAAFLLGRTAARGWIRRKAQAHPRFGAVDRAIGESGFKIILLLRLSPLFPFSLMNYALGLTRVRLSHYVLASAIGMLPGTIAYVYLGSLVTRVSELGSGAPAGSASRQFLYWGGLVIAVIATIVITKTARRALDRELQRKPEALNMQHREAHP